MAVRPCWTWMRSTMYWEIRVVVATRPTVQRSFSVRGTRSTAETRRDELVADFGANDGFPAASTSTVGGLIRRYIDAPHIGKPATVNSHRSVTQFLVADKQLADVQLTALTPSVAVAAIRRWQRKGATDPTVSVRWLVLRGSLSRATAEGLLRRNLLLGMRGPARPEPRLHLTIDEIHRLPATATRLAGEARGSSTGAPGNANLRRDLFVAEQTLLLVRLAADTGARRGNWPPCGSPMSKVACCGSSVVSPVASSGQTSTSRNCFSDIDKRL